MTAQIPSRGESKARAQRVTKVNSIESLVGAHPEALRDIYRAGEPADATVLGGIRPGRLLAIEPLEGAFVLTRPLVRGLARLNLFSGKSFESGGTAGRDMIVGGERFRYRCELAASVLDARPTLVMRYDGFDNPWPVSACVDELRAVAGIGLGLTALSRGRHARVLFWFALEL